MFAKRLFTEHLNTSFESSGPEAVGSSSHQTCLKKKTQENRKNQKYLTGVKQHILAHCPSSHMVQPLNLGF